MSQERDQDEAGAAAELPGADLARAFHEDLVAPLLMRALPRLRYAAGRLGSGSDVLGLPPAYRGLPVRFPTTWDRAEARRVEAATVGDFAASRLGLDPLHGLSAVDWLTLTGQAVLEVTAGPVFADETSELSRIRQVLRWYPPDVDRYVLAAGWSVVSEQMPLHGRTAERGDDLGSRVAAAAAVTSLMRLAFLLHRRWPPYAKWFGSLLTTLPTEDELTATLTTATTATRWQEREHAIGAYGGRRGGRLRIRRGPGRDPAPW